MANVREVNETCPNQGGGGGGGGSITFLELGSVLSEFIGAERCPRLLIHSISLELSLGT